jgi:hypothetical protein
MHPLFGLAHTELAKVYLKKGMNEMARASVEDALGLPGGELWRAAIPYILAVTGEQDRAREEFRKLERSAVGRRTPQTIMAAIHDALGDRDRAFELLEEVCRSRSSDVINLFTEGLLEGLRADPRYAEIRRKVGLEE